MTGMAQVWATNETMAVITRTSQMQTLDIFLESVKKTFRDPDWAQIARTQLHELKMMLGTTIEDYMAQFQMLMGRTGFNNAGPEAIYVWGLPNSILQKIRRFSLRLLSPTAWQHGRQLSKISTVSTEALWS